MTSGKLRPYEPIFMTFHRVGDAAAGVGLFLYLAWVYGMYGHIYPTAGILIFFTTLVTFRTVGLYRSWRVATPHHEIQAIILGCVAVYIMLLLAGYSLKASDLFSRRVVLTWMLIWPVFLGVETDVPIIGLGHHPGGFCPVITYLDKPLTTNLIKKTFPMAVSEKETCRGRKALKGLILAAFSAFLLWIILFWVLG